MIRLVSLEEELHESKDAQEYFESATEFSPVFWKERRDLDEREEVLRATAKAPCKIVPHYFDTRLVTECRDICGQLQKYLPRELRDKVYRHLVQKVYIWVEDLETFEDPASFVGSEGFENAYLLSSRYADVNERHEFAEIWY